MRFLSTERPGSNWRKILPGGTVRYKNKTYCHRILKSRVGSYVAVRTESYWGEQAEASLTGFPCKAAIQLVELVIPQSQR